MSNACEQEGEHAEGDRDGPVPIEPALLAIEIALHPHQFQATLMSLLIEVVISATLGGGDLVYGHFRDVGAVS